MAGFNLVSSLVMMVADKRTDIGILRTLGASRKAVMGIFMTQGLVVGIVGIVVGTLLGLFIANHVTEWANWSDRRFVFIRAVTRPALAKPNQMPMYSGLFSI